MHELFEFDLPRPLSPEGEKVLRQQLLMRRHHNVQFYEGIAVPWHNVQVLLLVKDEDTYQLIARSYHQMDEQQLVRFRARVAQVARTVGSDDPRIEQALQRQAPREESPVRYPAHSHHKRGLLDRLHLRRD